MNKYLPSYCNKYLSYKCDRNPQNVRCKVEPDTTRDGLDFKKNFLSLV